MTKSPTAPADAGFRPIEPIGAQPPSKIDPGPSPNLEWIEINRIVIEDAYQRAISDRGLRNIRQIAENFRWSRFTPVILAPRDDGFFALIDGQHRTTAAATLKIRKVPAQIVRMTARERAEAFTYINGAVTALTPMARFHAAVAAEEKNALAAQRALDSADARVLRYPVPASHMKPGDTLAAVSLLNAAEQFGEEALGVALRGLAAIRRPGVINASTILAASRLVAARPRWRAPDLAAAIAALDISRLLERAQQRKVGLNTRIAILLAEEMQAVVPLNPPDAESVITPSPELRPRTSKPNPGLPAAAKAFRLALDDELVSMIATKAGISSGCSRPEVLNPQNDEQRAAQALVVAWLIDHGYAVGVVARRLPGLDVEDALARAEKARRQEAQKVERFERLVADGLKMIRGAA